MTVAAVNLFGRHFAVCMGKRAPMKPPVARIAVVVWKERVIPSPTELRILHLSFFTLAFCGFSTPGARGKAGGERERREGV